MGKVASIFGCRGVWAILLLVGAAIAADAAESAPTAGSVADPVARLQGLTDPAARARVLCEMTPAERADPRTREAVQTERARLVPELARILAHGAHSKAEPERRLAAGAAGILGSIPVDAAVLAAQAGSLDFYYPSHHYHGWHLGDAYPCAERLSGYGPSAVPAVIDRVVQIDDPLTLALAGIIVRECMGWREPLLPVVEARIEKEKGPARRRLQQVLDYATLKSDPWPIVNADRLDRLSGPKP